jgi:hypothetical protein
MGVRSAALAAVFAALLALPAAAGAETCVNEKARGESTSKALPDCRVYELVTPTDKSHDSGGVRRPYYGETSPYPTGSSPDGSAVTYVGEQFYHALTGDPNQLYLSTRTPEGWVTANLMPAEPSEESLASARYVGFSQATGTGVLVGRSEPLAARVPVGYASSELYLRTSGGSYVPLITSTPPHRAPEEFGHCCDTEFRVVLGPRFVGASEDYGRIFFEANDVLTNGAADGGTFANNLYEWSHGVLRLVNVLPGGGTDAGAAAGTESRDRYGVKILPNFARAVSSDGSRVVWTDEATGDLYVRENNDQPDSPLDAEGHCTVPSDACTVLVAEGGEFRTATADGSEVFFMKEGHLYGFTLASLQTVDLAPGGEVEGIAGISHDGSWLYFVARTVLSAGATGGADNLYVRHGSTTSFIATLEEPDGNDLNSLEEYGTQATNAGVWPRNYAGSEARVSPDGRYLAFPSTVQLTSLPIPGVAAGPNRVELYLYDAVTGKLVCASCRPDGSTPARGPYFPADPALVDDIHQPRFLDSRGRVFFFSQEELVDGATEGGVFEYSEGHIYLLAANHEDELHSPGVTLLDASEDGRDVFLRTSRELVPEDQDGQGDIYDARENGRLPAAAPQTCRGEECQGEATSPPASPSLATSVSGPTGNLVANVGPGPSKPPKPLTRTQMLVRALKTCRTMRRQKRITCEREARKRYGPRHNSGAVRRRGKR